VDIAYKDAKQRLRLFPIGCAKFSICSMQRYYDNLLVCVQKRVLKLKWDAVSLTPFKEISIGPTSMEESSALQT
jgi:hypothetical protein